MWDHFSNYDNSVNEQTFHQLIENNLISLSLESGHTDREFVEQVAAKSEIPIQIESLSDDLAQEKSFRGETVFGNPGKYFDQVAENYPNMQWWLADKGLIMAVRPALHERLAEDFRKLKELPPQARGFAFEKFLNKMFAVLGLLPHASYRLIGEQIDGSFTCDGNTYLVEAKWQTPRIGNRDLQAFAGTVRAKADWTRGVYISISGFSEQGLAAFSRVQEAKVVCFSGQDLHEIFARKLSFETVLNLKLRRAAETGRAYIPVQEILGNE